MSDAGQVAPGWRWAPAWVLAFVALWPAPGYAEGVLALGALAGLVKLLDCHWYVIVPLPVAATLVNPAGSPPLHIV